MKDLANLAVVFLLFSFQDRDEGSGQSTDLYAPRKVNNTLPLQLRHKTQRNFVQLVETVRASYVISGELRTTETWNRKNCVERIQRKREKRRKLSL